MERLYRNMPASQLRAAITAELTAAAIPMVARERQARDVIPVLVCGKLGAFTFTRDESFWIMEGDMPQRAAEDIVRDFHGRCVEWCGPGHGPLLQNHLVYKRNGVQFMNLGRIKMSDRLRAELSKDGPFEVVDSPAEHGDPYVTKAHISSIDALKLVAATIRKYGLGGPA